MYDKRAKKILFETYWSSAGWKRAPAILPEDFDYAKRMGVMFEPQIVHHDKVIHDLTILANRIKLSNVTTAFLVSLADRDLPLRSALGSYAFARSLRDHKFNKTSHSICSVCGMSGNDSIEDLNVLNFERLKWGGVRHLNPVYALFDLQRFQDMKCRPTVASDKKVWNNLLEAISLLPDEAHARDIERSLCSIFPSNRGEREVFLNILGYCDILSPAQHPGFLHQYHSYYDRPLPPVNKIDWSYPVAWWRGGDGINRAAVEFWFA